MKVVDHLKKTDKTQFSLEVLPPKKGDNIQHLFDHIDPLMEFKPPFIDVTYHREEYVFKKMPNGLLQRKTTRKRPGTVGICAAIKNKYDVDTVPHIICGGFTREETENALIDLNFLGIDNVLLLRGDAIKSEARFIPEPEGNNYAIDLVNQVMDMNNGRYLDDTLENASSTDFCIGVAGYPEKHAEAPNMKIDLKYLKQKVDAGAEYIVTQMFFDNKKYFDFVDQCRAAGINVPIIPGLKPITTLSQIQILPNTFHIDLPEDLADALEDCKDNKQVLEVGVEWAIQQSKELMSNGVPTLHFYSMGKAEPVYRIAKELF
ncbi:MAG: methylenetetrahydrofolate reductase [NAD(P)H] [Cyclobacteriaceae bacterium]|nr:methylenetetrahydrofolate reductase [NAD(P)H] [Cyclobacteriaceae bacterium]